MRELTSIEKIQEFQRKLYEKAKANPKYRFYSLYDKTYRTDILEEGLSQSKIQWWNKWDRRRNVRRDREEWSNGISRGTSERTKEEVVTNQSR